MNRTIAIKVLLTPEEYIALQHLSVSTGESHSGLLRRLLLKHTREIAERMAGYTNVAPIGPEEGHE